MERLESLYANKFSKWTKLIDEKKDPYNPFRLITKRIVIKRNYDPGRVGYGIFQNFSRNVKVDYNFNGISIIHTCRGIFPI